MRLFYVLDRRAGKLISAEQIGKAARAERIDIETGRPVDVPGLRFEDGALAFWSSLWGVDDGVGIVAAPITYRAGGVQDYRHPAVAPRISPLSAVWCSRVVRSCRV